MAVSQGQFFGRGSAEGNLLALHPTVKPVAMAASGRSFDDLAAEAEVVDAA